MSVSRIFTGSSSRSVVSSAKLASTSCSAGITANTTADASGGESQVDACDDLLSVVVGLGAAGAANGTNLNLSDTTDSTGRANFVVANPLQRSRSSVARPSHTRTASSLPTTGDIIGGGRPQVAAGAPDSPELSPSFDIVPRATSSSSSGGKAERGQGRWPGPTGILSCNAGVATGLEGFRSQRVGKAMRLGSSPTQPLS